MTVLNSPNRSGAGFRLTCEDVFWLLLTAPDGFKLRVRTVQPVQLRIETSPHPIFLAAVVHTQRGGVNSKKSLAADSFNHAKLGRVQ